VILLRVEVGVFVIVLVFKVVGELFEDEVC